MNKVAILSLAFVSVATCPALAGEGGRETFGKWRIGIGGAFNSRVRSDLCPRNMPVPRAYSNPAASTREQAEADTVAHRWQGGAAFIEDDGESQFDTANWKLPSDPSVYDKSTSTFTLDNPYQEIVGSTIAQTQEDTSDNRNQFGISVEVSRELWIHDERDEHRWGVDFAAAFSYFFQRDVYSMHGVVTRTDRVSDGRFRTTVTDPDAMWDYDNTPLAYPPDAQGMYGHGNLGNYVYDPLHPRLGWNSIVRDPDEAPRIHNVVTSSGYTSKGDYQELEMLFMLRPWYEITDWWRVFAQAGVGVSWGRFDCTFRGAGVSADEDFSQWDVYGVAGLGTAFRYGHWDLGIDFLGRFLRDDLDVDGRHVGGSIDRADWGFRVMLGYSF